ncbi:Uncharacterised protein [Serratia marcescens]|nr:Uncharacterised protein [Serratia marcescens]CVA77503.1 Uncharacterised protein [Serratia marcescens]CVA99934.1 Uncharacterised protein [Serratia marcescens]CVC53978.1 Uncharacterised protein [Serratia marcescens]CVD34548.1 Uncharacterised protein [Serratia marcescens]
MLTHICELICCGDRIRLNNYRIANRVTLIINIVGFCIDTAANLVNHDNRAGCGASDAVEVREAVIKIRAKQ